MGLKLCQITDCHLTPDGTPLNDVDTTQTLKQVIDCLSEQHADCDAIIATGDIGHHGTRQEYTRFRQLTAELDKPVWCLPGNHDQPVHMHAELDRDHCRCPERIEAGGWQLLFLDSVIAGHSGGRIDPAQLTQCRKTLTRWPLPTLICLHHHPVSIGSPWMDHMGTENGDKLLDIATQFTQVQGLLWGHIHQPFDHYHGDCRLLGSPSTCFQFLPGTKQFAMDRHGPGWRWLELGDEGTIKTGIGWCDTGSAIISPAG